MCTPRSSWHSSIDDWKKRQINSHYHCLVSHQVAPCLFSAARAALLRTCAVKSDEVDYGDCRHDCDDDEQSHQEDHVEGDHVHDDHDDHDDHCSASGSRECLVKFFLFSTVQVACIQGVLWSSRCCCLLLGWIARPCTGLCSNAFPREWQRTSSFPALSCQTLPYRFACILVRACAVDVARH